MRRALLLFLIATPLLARVDRVDGFAQPRVAVIQRLAVHGVEHLGRDVGWPREIEGALAGTAGHGLPAGKNGGKNGRDTAV